MFARPDLRVLFVVFVLGAYPALAPAAPIDVSRTVMFDFDSLRSGGSNSSVQTYMNGILGSTGTVTVSNALPLSGYTGDGYVVGPSNGNSVTPITLGGTNSPGVYLVNDGRGASGDRISMEFDFPIYSVAFDFQIFPSTGWQTHTPDFSLWADGTLIFQKIGVVPGQEGTYAHSPNSGLSRNELVPQFIGSFATTFGGEGVRRLEFVDWPVRIGIDNLQLVRVSSPLDLSTPEPTTLLVCAALTGTLGLGWVRRRKTVSA